MESMYLLSRPEVRETGLRLFTCFIIRGCVQVFYCITISYTTIQNTTTTVVVFIVSHTYSLESHIHIQKLYISIHRSKRRTYSDEPLLVCWPSRMRKITVSFFCTYTDLKPVLSFTLSGKHMYYAYTHL